MNIQMSLIHKPFEPILAGGRYAAMAIPADRVARILGLRPTIRSMADVADAVEAGLPKHSLERVVERAGVQGPARLKLMHRVVPAATWKRRNRLKLVESEKTERLARVIALAELLWDDEAEARRFLATPHAELGSKKPIEAALTELGARQVEDIVMRALHGLPV
jgi:putative toxin-antitoxin system antitoxin component (TIGR02293 family)